MPRAAEERSAIPDPAKHLITLRRAAVAFRATPGRRGRLVVPDASEVFATGDLHGNLENLKRILKLADLAAHPRRHLVLQEFMHGPYHYSGGGEKSHQALDVLAALKCQYPDRVHFLLGNHELSQMTGRRIAKEGGDLLEGFRRGVATAYGDHSEAVYAAYMDLLAAAPLAVKTVNRVFLSHSLPPPAKPFDPAVLEQDECDPKEYLPGGSVHSLVWGRDVSEAAATAFLAKVDADLLITGHVPCEAGFERANGRQLILDSLGATAAFCLFPADRPLTQEELLQGVATL
jgi:hypothetical protein